MRLEFTIPLRTGTGLNMREHWAARYRRSRRERDAVWACFPRRKLAKGLTPPVTVRVTRISPSTRPTDPDNLQGGLKGVVDQIAEQLDMDDGDTKHIRFRYAQRRGPWGVHVEITDAQEK